jgi:hypothetical protein
MATAKVASDLAETMLGAQRVVSARLPMIGAAFTDPLNADHRELGRMVSEKVTAFQTSGRSIEKAGGATRDAAAANAKAWQSMAGGAMLWPNDWLRLFEINMTAWAAIATLPATTLAPIHAGVVANDKRLGGSKAVRARSNRPTQPSGPRGSPRR